MGKITVYVKGNWISSWIWNLVYGREYRVIVMGLDGAGKTTIMKRLQTGTVVKTIPKSVKVENFHIQMWDLGGQSSIRTYWRCYLANTDGIVFVVDSVDEERFMVCKAELMALLKEVEIEKVPVLILANKNDLADAKSAVQVSKALGLASISKRPWSIQQSSAKTGSGIQEGLLW